MLNAAYSKDQPVSERIAVMVDCTSIPPQLGGVGRYIEGIVGSLPAGSVDLTLAVRREHAAHFARIAPRARIVPAPRAIRLRPLRLLWEQVGLPLVARRRRATVLHSPHYTFPLLWTRSLVVTVHDATFFSDPGFHGIVKRTFFRAWTRLSLRRADVCVVPSRFTAAELARYVPNARAEISTVYHGVDTSVFSLSPDASRSNVERALGVEPGLGWIAFLGTIEPRKNVARLLEAHRMLCRALGDSAPVLLISGARGWDTEALELLDALGPQDGIRELGYLDQAILPGFLGLAEVVVYPSSAEGFGLPVLEAMSCGACVLTTPHSALPEVGGDAVSYCEPTAEDIAAALERLLLDDAARSELRERAVVRAREFSWERAGREHAKAYASAASA